MAVYANEKYLIKCSNSKEHWTLSYAPGEMVPVSGIYRCVNCGKEIAANKDDPFPPQNHHQHYPITDILWKLVIRADTKADNCGIRK